MRIFKFGGASVKDAESVRNVARVLQHEGTENLLVVISAMGKMTNAFEEIINNYFYKKDSLQNSIDFVVNYHQDIINDLFEENNEITNKVNLLFGELSGFMAKNTSTDYNYVYDQIVGFGELISTNIVSAYLTKIGVNNQWLDVRDYIQTNSNFRDAKIDWKLTEKKISENVNTSQLNITQGFLGSNGKETTTLGREGSDYTAGIFAYCLDAENVSIWKDVDGVLNADPRVFTETELLHEISYTEAIEMAFYGASVIHPKTIQPLEQKNIPLFVRSFKDITKNGTCVGRGKKITPEVPCFIVKKNQILASISAKDFSFMVEHNISDVFKKLHEYKLKVNLIQNSAISFSVCIEDKYDRFDAFYNDLQTNFNIKSYKNVTLYTIRHFNDTAIKTIQKRGKAIIRQINTETAQLVIE
ncbi:MULTISPECIES: aspartate kinase [unclassified Tenacibaculum]|uniref:aspartate kinase n=1 Tax=unclassified Tenacibaculum TaxID=2635139 RepID=UPI001F27C890|nr:MULTISPECIES: aspartate kinase [unclassified Tenacibaculum]MCF2874910.1 aspartate kinase [Tenacibaculum sp. Cn5-1]MCF2934024.1 aspartate kinase [Tenacibaculum sp. Cn5-34]MCG7510234.1 aspartate kinase [Tenacibaculum sp. Cn5-46]